MKRLCYRADDDTFVIMDGDTVLGSTNASDMLARQTLDPKAAAHGLRRFLTFADWQVNVAGTVLWKGTAEDAMAQAPRP